MKPLNILKASLTIALVVGSANASAEGMLTNIVTSVSDLAALSQTAVLRIAGLAGLILFAISFFALRGNNQSQTTKGAAAAGIVIGLVLMYVALFVKGAAEELGIDDGSAAVTPVEIHVESYS